MGKDLNYYLSEEYRDYLFSEYKKQVDQANKACRVEFTKVAKKKIESFFETAIKNFYDNYTPKHYDRNESLYSIYELKESVSENGAGFVGNFDPNKMTGFRNGYKGENGLYDQVFRKGWHGGAGSGDITQWRTRGGEKIKIRTPHPNPGKPYWRRKAFITWFPESEPASVAETSPYDSFTKLCRDYWEGKEGMSDYFICWNAAAMNYIKNIEV